MLIALAAAATPSASAEPYHLVQCNPTAGENQPEQGFENCVTHCPSQSDDIMDTDVGTLTTCIVPI